ncbi:glycoside hydrolase family 16 protein [Streptacidiphilus rugosus]|uniref:glycoside hydrolase family 16 protein n=1 Tax=Streptacidiphilus rugosus TaxID=405783 RepID=UPI0005648009|nr:glycoside hydrolase family 16 protein [Streptacidiphilus rugosus]
MFESTVLTGLASARPRVITGVGGTWQLGRFGRVRWMLSLSLTSVVCVGLPPSAQGAAILPVPGRVVFYDDFGGTRVDSAKWYEGPFRILSSPMNNGAIPQNLSVHSVPDGPGVVSVLDVALRGDKYDDGAKDAVRGVIQIPGCTPAVLPSCYAPASTGKRTGGLLWTTAAFGSGRYEVRMKTMPLGGGCSCIWNYYDPGNGAYTEIDTEVAANAGQDARPSLVGFNSYAGQDGATNMISDVGTPQNDGRFHTYRWDWYDGSAGQGPAHIDWYVDGVRYAMTNANVPTHPAQLWVGGWPAPWSGDYAYATQHLYIDWVKITSWRGRTEAAENATAPK